MKTRTMHNLTAAMQAEAAANAKFLRFAAAARLHDDASIAALFEEAADVDRCRHFAREAELAHLTGTEDENLHSAIESVIGQIAMYDGFIRQATADRDGAAVRILERVRGDKVTQLLAFRAALLRDAFDTEASAAFLPLSPSQLIDQRNSPQNTALSSQAEQPDRVLA
jgi:rubrerythrin